MCILTKDLKTVKDLTRKGYYIDAMSYIGPIGTCEITFHMKKMQ